MTIILKVTNGCNLRCKYCSVGDKSAVTVLNKEQLLSTMIFVGNVCKKAGEKNLTIILHGGEPTLISPVMYDLAFEELRKCYKELNFRILMQTNGTFFSEEMLNLIEKWDIGIGISIDGSPEIHNCNRVDIKGKGTFERIVSNVRKLHERGIAVSGLIVLTQQLLYENLEYLKIYEKENINIKINPVLNIGEAEKESNLNLQEGQYAQYIIRVFEYILEERLNLTVSPIDNFLYSQLKDNVALTCTFNKNCSKEFLCIDSQGDVYPCGKYADIHVNKLGTIEDLPEKILNNNIIDMLGKRRSIDLPERCSICKYVTKCNAGCSFEACVLGDISRECMFCYDYQMLFEYFSNKGLDLFRKALLQKRAEIENQMVIEERDGTHEYRV